MGKQVARQRKKKTYLSLQTVKQIKKQRMLTKTKSLIQEITQNIGKAIKKVRNRQNKSLAENFQQSLISVILKRCLKRVKLDQYDENYLLTWALEFSKVCQICKQWKEGSSLVFCEPCEDGFHLQCLVIVGFDNFQNLKRKPKEDWLCPHCKKQKRVVEQNERMSKVTINRDGQPSKVNSQNRRRLYLRRNHKQIQCVSCSQYYHHSQFAHDNFLCSKCTDQTLNSKYAKLFAPYKNIPKNLSAAERKDCHFFLPNYRNIDPQLLQRCKRSLLIALEVQGLTFLDELIYEKTQIEQNDTKLEFMLQEMKNANLQVFKEFKRMTNQACFGPLWVIHDPIQGYIVKAELDIAQGTLICEYVGSVYVYRDVVFSKNDSIMTLLQSSEASTTLVILPEKYGNIAKFISGINNFQKQLRRKQNVASLRVDIQGQARIILYTIKHIARGETLYYDYNAGGGTNYDTQQFV